MTVCLSVYPSELFSLDFITFRTHRLALSVTLPLSSRSVTSNATTQIHESVTGLDMLVFYEVRVQDRAKYIVDAVTHFPYRNGGDAMGKDGRLRLSCG